MGQRIPSYDMQHRENHKSGIIVGIGRVARCYKLSFTN